MDVNINKMPTGAMALRALQGVKSIFAAAGEFPFARQSSESPDIRICASIARYDIFLTANNRW